MPSKAFSHGNVISVSPGQMPTEVSPESRMMMVERFIISLWRGLRRAWRGLDLTHIHCKRNQEHDEGL